MLLFCLFACTGHLITGTHDFDGRSAAWTAYVPPDDGSPYGAAVLLPADDAEHDFLPRRAKLQRWARANHSIVLSIDAPAPDGNCWWTPYKHARAAFLADAMQALLYDSHAVERERVHLGGWSGGAFLAFGAPFIAEIPFEGGLIGVCGGDVPREDSATNWCEIDETQDDPPMALEAGEAEALAQGRRVFLARNDDDDWVQSEDAAAALWREAGAEVQVVSDGDGGHCALPVVQRLVDGLEWVGEER